jgi:hypothetical protein
MISEVEDSDTITTLQKGCVVELAIGYRPFS